MTTQQTKYRQQPTTTNEVQAFDLIQAHLECGGLKCC